MKIGYQNIARADDKRFEMFSGEPHSAVRRRPRVLLIPNTATWIIGEMAVQIMKRYGQEYEFWFVTDKLIQLRPDLIRALAPTLDFIFPLSDRGFQLLKQAIGPVTIPSIFWVHHVSSWNASMCDAVAHASELIACTEEWKQRIEERCPPHVPITVVPHGLDLNEFQRTPAARARLGMPKDAFVVGFVGSKRSDADGGRKGLDVLDAVLATVKSQIANLHISFLGLGWDEEVKRLHGKGISANYVGFIAKSDLPIFYSSIDTYLMTSRVEGGPCTVLEAMGCQTPVVATRVGLVPQTIVHRINSFSAAVDDVQALSSSLCTLAHDANLRAQIGKAARTSVASGLAWHQTLTSLEQPLRRMARRSPLNSRHPSANVELPKQFHGAVHALDGFLSSIGDLRRGLTRPSTSVRMLLASLQGCDLSDLVRGAGLATRLCFRPSLVRSQS